jgi:glycosyltransferase involved in cell wall biosynthesis
LLAFCSGVNDKLISISEFTKNEFEKYALQKELYNINFPVLKTILLPYQYRNKDRIYTNCEEGTKVTILVPGTIESRKQQLILMKLFNQFIQNNPFIDVEMILFGTVLDMYRDVFNKEIIKSKGKMLYLGMIDNETLSSYYKKASFACFISLYEGFGFPISESLWHGVPVLTSNIGSMMEVARDGGCYTIDVTKEAEIYKALDTLIKDPSIIINLKEEIKNVSLPNWKEYGDLILKEMFDLYK